MYQEQKLIASCQQTVSILTATMASHGYRLERSFDLRSALHNHPDCPCPHHGTAQCTCQYMVLLVYEQATSRPPVAISLHECDGITRLRVDAGPFGGALSWSLLAAIDEALNAVLSDV